MNRNKQWWRDLATNLLNDYEIRMFNEIAKNLEDGVIKNETALNDDDYIDELIDQDIMVDFNITSEELDALRHGELK